MNKERDRECAHCHYTHIYKHIYRVTYIHSNRQKRDHQCQGLLLNHGVGNLMCLKPGGIVRCKMEDADACVLLEEDGPDTHSTGGHEDMEWLVVVWCLSEGGRGDEGFEVFKTLVTLLCPLKTSLGAHQRG